MFTFPLASSSGLSLPVSLIASSLQSRSSGFRDPDCPSGGPGGVGGAFFKSSNSWLTLSNCARACAYMSLKRSRVTSRRMSSASSSSSSSAEAEAEMGRRDAMRSKSVGLSSRELPGV